jgi:exodeoxyribonuclease V alpha subunit
MSLVGSTETVEGVVASVLSQLAAGAIFSMRTAGGADVRIVLDGQGLEPEMGDPLRVAGRWREHPTYGWQLHAPSSTCRRIVPRNALIVPWLCSLPGIGPKRAKRLTEHYGSDLGSVLGGGAPIEDIARVIDDERPHLAARIAGNINMSWVTLMGEYETTVWLEEQGIVDAGVARMVRSLMGAGASAILAANPYVLSGILPWRQVDLLGRRILEAQRPGRTIGLSMERLVGAVDAEMREVTSRGDTAAPKDAFMDDVAKRIGHEPTPELTATLVTAAVRNQAVIDGGMVWRSPGCAVMEDEVAVRCRRMALGLEASGRVLVPLRHALAERVETLAAGDRALHPEQKEAVCKVLGSALSCLVGGGGTGKTSTCRAIVEIWEGLGGRVEMAALSGMAALRLTEGVRRGGRQGLPALTIHRLLLGLRKRRDGATHWAAHGNVGDEDVDLPLLDERTLLIVDEASMVGLGEIHQILDFLPPGCRLLLVGDPFQLPPVSFGIFFHRLVAFDQVTARLTTVHRQTEASGIPMIAAAIRCRTLPPLQRFTGVAAGVFIVPCDEEDLDIAVEEVVEILDDEGTFADLRIVAAFNESGAGSVLGLNTRFHDAHVARTGAPSIKGWLGQWFALGEPVVHVRNDYERSLRNGSLGTVVAVDEEARGLTVRFDGIDREVQFTRDRLIDLALAYAITAHRAQGSQARRVVIPIPNSEWIDPTWVYTALTRAEEQAVFVGDPKALAAALKQTPAYERRICDLRFDLENPAISSAA